MSTFAPLPVEPEAVAAVIVASFFTVTCFAEMEIALNVRVPQGRGIRTNVIDASREHALVECSWRARSDSLEVIRIEPVIDGMDLRRGCTCGIGRNRASLVRIANLIWTLEGVSVVGEEHPRSVAAVHYEQRKSRGGVFDKIHLPVPEYGVRRPVPTSTVLLSLAKWQVIQNAGREIVIQI